MWQLRSKHTVISFSSSSPPSPLLFLLLLLLLQTTFVQSQQIAPTKPNAPRSIRLESVLGAADSMDVRITAPLLNDIRADPILFPTLWNVSYGFLLRQEKTSVHRVMYDQKTTAIIRMTTIGAGSVPHLASEHNIVAAEKFVSSIVALTSSPSPLAGERSECSSTWECPSRIGTPCHLEINKGTPLLNIPAASSTTNQNSVYHLITHFSSGDPESNRSSTKGWEIMYGASMTRGVVIRLNGIIVDATKGPIFATSPIIVSATKFDVLEGWNVRTYCFFSFVISFIFLF